MPTADRPATTPPPAGPRRRPRGRVRHYAGLLSPDAAAAMPLMLERNRAQRGRRLAGAVLGAARRRGGAGRTTMRALVASPGAQLHWRTVQAPRLPGPDGAIVHPIAVATCDIDCPLVLGATQLLLPLQLGHECVAEVLSVGGRVATVRPGDRVIVPFQVSCGKCQPCTIGRPGSCLSVPPVSAYGMGVLTGHFGGAFSDQVAVPYADAMLVPLPEGIDPVAAASASDNICDAYRHIGPHLPGVLKLDPDAEVLILAALGSHPVFSASTPLYTGMIARAMGARKVTLVDSRGELRQHAERLGIDTLHPHELHRRHAAPLVVHISADPLAIALAHTAPDGICTSTGGLHRAASVPMLKMYVRRVTLHVGVPHARALIPQVLELMREGDFRPERAVTAVASLEEAPAVLREHVLAGATKTVLTAS